MNNKKNQNKTYYHYKLMNKEMVIKIIKIINVVYMYIK